MSVGYINIVRYCVIEASRNRAVVGPVCWIGIMETKTSKDSDDPWVR